MKDLMKKFRYVLLKLLFPVLKFIGKLHMPYSRKELSGEDYYAIRRIVKKGDVFITKTFGEVTNLAIPGDWSHGGMYAGEENDIPMVIEARGVGVVKRPLVDFILEKDRVRVLRPKFATEQHMSDAVDAAVGQVGSPYDYGFRFSEIPQRLDSVDENKPNNSTRAFYCVELIVWAYRYVMGKIPFVIRETLGEPGVTPDDFVLATKHWKQIWDKEKDGTTWG